MAKRPWRKRRAMTPRRVRKQRFDWLRWNTSSLWAMHRTYVGVTFLWGAGFDDSIAAPHYSEPT